MTLMNTQEMIQHLVDKVNKLEEEKRELVKNEVFAKPVCQKTVQTFGKEHTMLAAIDEMSELTQALTKVIRGNADFDLIDQKIADVEILTECLKSVFSNGTKVKDWKEKKILALSRKI